MPFLRAGAASTLRILGLVPLNGQGVRSLTKKLRFLPVPAGWHVQTLQIRRSRSDAAGPRSPHFLRRGSHSKESDNRAPPTTNCHAYASTNP